MQNFFVTGLPRSRTAWFSTFLTYGDSYCYHDALAACSSIEELKIRMGTHPYTGNSDCGVSLLWELMLRTFEEAPILIIERDVEESKRSFTNFCGLTNIDEIYDLMLEGIDKLKDNGNVLTMPFYAVDTEAAWKFLVHDEYDRARAEQVDKVIINSSPIVTDTQIDNIHKLFRGIL